MNANDALRMLRFDDAPELAPYQDEPAQMPAGAPGKNGFLRLGFERRGTRTALIDLVQRAPLLAQKALYYDEAMPHLPHVMIVCTAGGVLQGDRQAIEIALKAGAEAHVTTQSATKIQEMDANFAAQSQAIVLDEDAYLEYLPDPVIPYRNARFVTRTRICLPQSATLVYSEVLMPGRTHYREGERFEYALFSSSVCAERPDGSALCTEKFVVEPQRRNLREIAIMGGFNVFANVLVFAPREHSQRIFAETPAQFVPHERWAAGATRLPNDAGLAYKIVGDDREAVQEKVRVFADLVRRVVKNAGTAPHFQWR